MSIIFGENACLRLKKGHSSDKYTLNIALQQIQHTSITLIHLYFNAATLRHYSLHGNFHMGGSATESHARNVSNGVSHDTGDVKATKPRKLLARVNCFKTLADCGGTMRGVFGSGGTESDRNKLT